MALFGSVGKVFSKVIHNPVVQVLFPVAAAGNLLAQAGLQKAVGIVGGQPSVHAVQQPSPLIMQQTPTQQDSSPVPYQPAGYSGYQDPFAYGGGYPSWDYSIQSPVYSIPQPVPQSQPYSTSASRPWEDLIAGAGAALFL